MVEPLPPRRRFNCLAACLVVVLLLLPVLYVLSIGPVAVLADRGFLSRERFATAYAPVMHFGDNPLVRELLRDYVGWWYRITSTPMQ